MVELSLPDAELDVMACLWRDGSMTARQLREALADRRPMSHPSISTLLNRLRDKRLVSREKGNVGKAFVFRAAVEPNDTYRHLVGDLLDRIFGGSGIALMTSLFEARRPTREELDELVSLVDEMRATNRKATSTKKGSKRS